MGMYTGIRVKAFVKEEYREMIQAIHDGADWADFVDQFPFLSKYASLDRAEFIPRGVLCYMPSEWEEGDFPNERATDSFERKIDMETGYWTFQCSLKNYEHEIQCFFEEVLPKIIEKAEHIEYYYEEWDKSQLYGLVDGKIEYVGDGKDYWG